MIDPRDQEGAESWSRDVTQISLWKTYEKSAAIEQAEDPSHYFVVNLTPIISPCNKVSY